MWLLPAQTRLAGVAARSYYRTSVMGGQVPESGPVLLLANHPNSLLDPAFVILAAGRPVRFLAKAPLFRNPFTGWFVRASGAIPVYRRSDDPALVGRNVDAFRSVREALAHGSAVGIFPEGLSHHLPSLAPFKTGAARVALQAAADLGGSFPVIPVGLTFRGKDRYRSEALILVGPGVPWEDLAGEAEAPASTVRELTRRMETGLHQVTLNVERWEEAPLVQRAEEIRQLEVGPAEVDPERHFRGIQAMSRVLQRTRPHDDAERTPARRLVRELGHHVRILDLLGLEPRDLHSLPSIAVAARSAAVHLVLFGLVAPVAVAGAALFALPHQLVTRVGDRLELGPQMRATFAVAVGGLVYLAWSLALAGVAWRLAGWLPALLVLLVVPLLGLAALWTHQRWRGVRADLRKFLVLRQRADVRSRLLERQRELAERLDRLVGDTGAATPDPPAPPPGPGAP